MIFGLLALSGPTRVPIGSWPMLPTGVEGVSSALGRGFWVSLCRGGCGEVFPLVPLGCPSVSGQVSRVSSPWVQRCLLDRYFL